MASTYTDIGTELMTTGENAGNWGTKTNTNLQILEEALRGYVAQSIAGGVQTTALTYTDGTVGDAARNMVIALTGTITGNQTVTVPAVEKMWVIDNQTTGAYTVNIKVSGQTGVTWAATDKGTKILYGNGTDVVDTDIGGVGAYDLNGEELTLDADADTSITASTDDQIDFELAGADDFTMTANAFNVLTGSHVTFADSANAKFGTSNDMLVYHDGSNSYITNAVGALKIATETSGIAVTIGHTTSETTIADNLTVTGTLTGTLATAAQGSVTSLGTLTTLTVDNIITNGTTIGHTSDTDLLTLTSGVLTVAGELDATTLDISGSADIDGTTNLDAVDIDGAVQLDATLTIGADDQGYDVIFYGDTASANLTWDTSADDLILNGAARIVVPDSGLVLGSTAVTSTAAEINLIDGGTARGTTAVADADGILHNDAGTMRMTSAATFKTYFQEGITSTPAADDISAGDDAVNLTTSSGNITIDAAANNSDIIFKGTDATADITMLTLDGSEAGLAIFNDSITVGDNLNLTTDSTVINFGADSDTTLTHTDGTGLTLNSTNKLCFQDTGTFINSNADGDLDLGSDGTAADSILATSAGGITLDANATGSTGVITLDAQYAGEILLKDGGTTYGDLYTSSNDFYIKSAISDGDIILRGNDGGSSISALVLDMSAAGAATFNDKVIATELDISGNMDIDGTSNLDAVDIDGAVQLDATLTIGANDQGYDVILYGDTASANVTWDTSADDLIFNGGAGLIVPDGQFTLGSTAVAATAAELNKMDGGTSATSTTVADADRVVLNDNGTMVQVAMTDIKTYIGGGTSWQAVKTGNFTAAAGQGVFANTTSSAFTVTLPAGTIGDEVSIIDYAGTFDSNNLTVAANGSEKIHGSTDDLTVATERAAFTLVFTDSTQGWLLKDK